MQRKQSSVCWRQGLAGCIDKPGPLGLVLMTRVRRAWSSLSFLTPKTELILITTWFCTSGFLNCERIKFSCFKPPSSWYLVSTALGNKSTHCGLQCAWLLLCIISYHSALGSPGLLTAHHTWQTTWPSGPLHLQFPLPGTVFPESPMTSSHTQFSAQMSPSKDLLWISYLKSALNKSQLLYSASLFFLACATSRHRGECMCISLLPASQPDYRL